MAATEEAWDALEQSSNVERRISRRSPSHLLENGDNAFYEDKRQSQWFSGKWRQWHTCIVVWKMVTMPIITIIMVFYALSALFLPLGNHDDFVENVLAISSCMMMIIIFMMFSILIIIIIIIIRRSGFTAVLGVLFLSSPSYWPLDTPSHAEICEISSQS